MTRPGADIDHEQETLPSGVVVHRWTASRAAWGVIVLQHGFNEYAERFVAGHAGIVSHAVASGLDVVAPDMWGHGRTPGARSQVHVEWAIAEHRAARKLASRDGLPVFVMGHSLGGLVTAGSVAKDGDGVAGVVLTSPALPADESALTRRFLKLLARLAPARPILRAPRPLDELSRDPAVGVAAASDPLMNQGQVSNLTAATSLDAMAALRGRLDAWCVPTLVAHGTADTYTDPRQSRVFVDAIESEDKSLVAVEGGRHELLNEPDGDVLRNTVLEWIRTRSRR